YFQDAQAARIRVSHEQALLGQIGLFSNGWTAVLETVAGWSPECTARCRGKWGRSSVAACPAPPASLALPEQQPRQDPASLGRLPLSRLQDAQLQRGVRVLRVHLQCLAKGVGGGR